MMIQTTEDEVLKMAVQAGATKIGHKPPAFHFYLENLEDFAKLVAADADAKATAREREVCIKGCRDMFVVGSVSWNLLNEKLKQARGKAT